MRRILFTVGTLVCLLALMPCASAHDDSVKTLLFVGDSESGYSYDVGDNVPVEVRFFDLAQPADADSAPTVTLNSYESNSREISVGRTGQGVYTGSFTITEADVAEYNYIDISAEATLGKDSETDSSYDSDESYQGIIVSGDVGFDVRLVFDGSGSEYIMADPGDTIPMTITVTDNGNNIDPDIFDLTADDKKLTYTRTGTGLYKATYIVSSTVQESQRVDIEVNAEYGDEETWEHGTIIVDLFALWYHEIGITSSYAQFELCAADKEGSALRSAGIDFSYEIDDYGVDHDSPSQSGATDSEGRAPFTISHSSASTIYIEGTLQYSGRTQHFQGNIVLDLGGATSQIDEPWDWDNFEVIYQQNAGSLSPGKTVTLDFIAYEYAVPVSNKPIYYYLHTQYDFIKSGSTSCDGQGRFSITLTVPESAGTIYAEFESPFEKEDSWDHCDCDDGLVYRASHESVYATGVNIFTDRDTSISIETDSFEIGGMARITATRPNSQGFLGFALVLAGEVKIEDISESYRPKWEAWVGLSLSLIYPLSVTNNRIIQDFLLPEFLPEDETYTVFAMFVDPNQPGFEYHWNYIHVKPETSQEDEEEGLRDFLFSSPVKIFGQGIPCLLILLVMIILLLVVAAASRPRKEETRPPAPTVVTVEPEPAVASPRTPYASRYDPQQRSYSGDYYGSSGPPPSRSRAPETGYPQHTRRYHSSEAAYRDDIRREPRSHPPPAFKSAEPPVREPYEPSGKRFPSKPSSVTVRCQGCRNVFYIQDKTPPFKTKCPVCAKDNIVV